jgi:nucleotide-binding universal stress UspA family protein
MSIVLAALDTSAAARAVLETAVRIGQLTGADVEAIHVHAGPPESVDTPEPLTEVAGRSEVPLRLIEGPVEPSLIAAMTAPEVLAAVIGARATPDGHRLMGRTARTLLEQADKPVVVVPPDATALGVMRRLLVPLEGTDVSSRPVLERLLPLLSADIELVVLHVFNETTLPAMLDRPYRDLDLLGKEFLTRHCPSAELIELRTGPVATRVTEVSEEHRSDLIVLSWSQNLSPERAHVVRNVLGASVLPVLLLPIAPSDIDEADAVSSAQGESAA